MLGRTTTAQFQLARAGLKLLATPSAGGPGVEPFLDQGGNGSVPSLEEGRPPGGAARRSGGSACRRHARAAAAADRPVSRMTMMMMILMLAMMLMR